MEAEPKGEDDLSRDEQGLPIGVFVVIAVSIAIGAVLAGINLGVIDDSSQRTAFAVLPSGDFPLDFVAAENTTYYQSGPNEGQEISGAIEGQDLGFDDRTINVDVVEQLEAEDFQCDDRIIFFTQIGVADGAASDQDIFLVYHFDAVNNGQQGVGYSEVLDVGVSAVDFPAGQVADDGNVGLSGGETAILQTPVANYLPPGSSFGVDANILEAKVRITDLDPSEHLIVRVDVRFSCFASPVTGNLHAAIQDAFVDDANETPINVGQQDVPMIGLGGVATPTPTPTLTATPTPTPTPIPTSTPTPPAASSPTATAVLGEVQGPTTLPATGGTPTDGNSSSLSWLAAVIGGLAMVAVGGFWVYKWGRAR